MYQDIYIDEPTGFEEIRQLEHKLLAMKYGIWDELVREAGYGYFNSLNLGEMRNAKSGTEYYSSLTTCTRMPGRAEGARTVFQGGQLSEGIYSITFGMEKFRCPIIGVVGDKAVNKPSVDFNDALEAALDAGGVLLKMKSLSKLLSRETNHDFIHNATLGSEVFDPTFATYNGKNTNIHGYEHYSLALHQLIFARLRLVCKDKVDLIHSAACDYGDTVDVLEKDGHLDKDAYKLMYKFLYYLLGNLVCGKSFQTEEGVFSTDRKLWKTALETGDLAHKGHFLVNHERFVRPASLEEISAIVYTLHFEKPVVLEPGDWERGITTSKRFTAMAAR
jgi:hypothetical protein